MPETTAHMILSSVEALAPSACGAFLVELDDSSVGSVFVEKNQVCWAAYTGLGRRLRDLLRDHLTTAMNDAELERTYRKCVEDGARLGEVLVARDLIKAEAMRRALKQHTIESLVALPHERGERIDWVGHRYQGYQPKFTFAPVELLVAVNSLLYATEAAGAELALSIIDADVCGASFVPADSGGLIAVRVASSRTTICDIDELGGWADAAFGVTRGFSRDVMRRAIIEAPGEVCVAWQTSRVHTHAVVLERGEVLERLVATLTSRSLPAVVSRRASRSSLAVRDALGAVADNP